MLLIEASLGPKAQAENVECERQFLMDLKTGIRPILTTEEKPSFVRNKFK